METKTLFLIIAALVATGCTSTNSAESSAAGVQIEEFSITDNSLSPEQEANLRLQVANHNKYPTSIETVEIFNKGELKVSDKNCNSKELRAAKEDLKPRMECTWTVKAPDKEFLKGFDSKPAPIKLELGYRTRFENGKPLKISYQDLNEIEESSEKSISFSNGEIEAELKSETPTAKSNPSNLNLKIENNGPGRVEGNYVISYTPNNLLENCPENEEPVIEDSAEFSCSLETSNKGIKNVFVTIGYKYTKSPNLDIKVVK